MASSRGSRRTLLAGLLALLPAAAAAQPREPPLSDAERAEHYYRRARAVLEDSAGVRAAPALPGSAPWPLHPADLPWDAFAYEEAEPLLRRALAAARRAHGHGHPEVARIAVNLAALYTEIGDYDEAELLLDEAPGLHAPEVAAGASDLAAEAFDMAAALEVLAALRRARGLPERAESPLREALALLQQRLGEHHPRVASTLLQLAALRLDSGHAGAARALLSRALSVRTREYGEEHPLVAAALLPLGRLRLAEGHPDEAAAVLLRALTIFEATTGVDHPEAIACMLTLAWARLTAEHTAAAVRWLERAIEAQDRNARLLLAYSPEARQRAHLATLQSATDAAITLHVRHAPEHPGAARIALTTLLRRKERALDARADHLSALRRLGREESRLLERLRLVQAELASLVARGDRRPERLSALEEELHRLDLELTRRGAELRATPSPVTLEQVRAALPPGAVLVEIAAYQPLHGAGAAAGTAAGEPCYVAYLLDANGIEAVELGEVAAIDRLARRFRRALADPARDPRALARELDGHLLAPLRPLLRGARRIFVAPDGELNLIPFSALLGEDGHYAAEHLLITYLTTGRDLLRFDERRAPRQGPVLVADPDFDGLPVLPDRRRGRRAPDLDAVRFPPLPHTAAEARAIARMLPGARILVGPQAGEAAIKALRGPEILHLATHGFYLPTPERPRALGPWESPLLRSGVALAGANRRDGDPDDGVLTALEASSLDLEGTRLVVLSACESGLGQALPGEGVGGLRRALVLAGAETQVMSLWPVDDEATQSLMVSYYDALLAGLGRSEALRRVSLRMMRSPETAHPYYWAGFIVSGNGAPLDGRWRGSELEDIEALAPPKVAPGPRGCACGAGGDGGGETGRERGGEVARMVVAAFLMAAQRRSKRAHQ